MIGSIRPGCVHTVGDFRRLVELVLTYALHGIAVCENPGEHPTRWKVSPDPDHFLDETEVVVEVEDADIRVASEAMINHQKLEIARLEAALKQLRAQLDDED
jgi:hypothetical protein